MWLNATIKDVGFIMSRNVVFDKLFSNELDAGGARWVAQLPLNVQRGVFSGTSMNLYK